MSWVNELIDLYEINSDKIGVIEYRRDMPYVLLPPFHTTVTAQIKCGCLFGLPLREVVS